MAAVSVFNGWNYVKLLTSLMKKRPQLNHLLLTVQAIFVGAFFVLFLGSTFPLVGADYRYFIPRLIDSELFYQINGLGIQWYTPSFGGGLPSYPNPQQIQFSIPQLLTTVLNPWSASLISIAVFLVLGTIGFYILGTRVMGLDTVSSLIGALFFTFNGYSLQHMGIGHLTFMGFPLLPFVLIGLLSRQKPLLNGLLLGWVFAVLLYGGGFYSIVYFVFSVLLILPLLFFFFPGRFQLPAILRNAVSGAILTLALSASKLFAVLAFLQNFPRHIEDVYKNSLSQSLLAIPLQLLGSMSLSPLGTALGQNHKFAWDLLMTYTGSELSLWELDMALSPALFLVLALGLCLLVLPAMRGAMSHLTKQWGSAVLFLLAFALTVQFIIAKGPVYAWLSKLPILSSLHVNPRYTATLILPLALVASIILQGVFNKFKFGLAAKVFTWLFILAITAAFGSVYFTLPMDTLQRRQFDVSGSMDIWKNVQLGETYPVLSIQDDLRDARVFDQHASTLTPYEVLFGYGMGNFKPALHVGSVYDVVDGKFNINDPSGFVYGAANHSQPFDRINVADRDKLEDFIQRKQPAWNLPVWQLIANWLSLGAVVFSILYLLLVIYPTRSTWSHWGLHGNLKK